MPSKIQLASQTLALLLAAVFLGVESAQAAEQAVGTVDADTSIARDDNDDDEFDSCCGITNEEDAVLGGLQFMQIRGGAPFSGNSATIKSLVRFNLGATVIDPDIPYFVEVETVAPGGLTGGPGAGVNSNDTFRMYAIDDATLQAFNEGTLTWNNSGTGNDNLNNFNSAGSEVGIFFSENAANTKLYIPIMGSQIAQFTSGTTMATFGFTSTETNRMSLKTKEAASGVARLISYDTVSSSSSGNLTAAGTWSGGAPVADTLYRVGSGHTVTVNGGVFAGRGVIVDSGGTLNFAANDVDINNIVINPGGSIAHAPGSRTIGGDTNEERNGGSGSEAPRGFFINTDLTYTAAAGEDLDINIPLRADPNTTFTFAGGAGSDLTLRFPQGHRGTIHFSGSGDSVFLTEDEGIGGTLVMDSSASNKIVYQSIDTEQEFGVGTIRFDQAGTIEHSGNNDRLQGEAFLEVNAPLTIDMSTNYQAGFQERRYRVTRDVSGAGSILAKGTASAPSSSVLPNTLEFSTESGNETNNHTADDYTGTLTTEGHIIVRSRLSMPEATINVAAKGEFQTGHLTAPEERVRFGEINVAGETSAGAGDSGILTVGATNNNTATLTNEEHRDQLLVLSTSTNGSGDLNLTPDAGSVKGSITRMTISSDPNGGLFDQIEVQGDATLGGKLQVIVNADHPTITSQYDTPNIGDTFDIIYAGGGGLTTRTADFDGLNGVDPVDLGIWETNYDTDSGATNATGDADGDGAVSGLDFLAWQDEFGTGLPTGTISGTFDELEVIDAAFGVFGTYTFSLDYSEATAQFPKVKLVLTGYSPLSAVTTSVPEPSSFWLLLMAWMFGAGRVRLCLCRAHIH